MSNNEQKVYDTLKDLGVEYVKYEHPPVFTVEQALKHYKDIPGAHCKSLFLRNKKGKKHYLLVLKFAITVDLKTMAEKLGEDSLSFASEKRLMKYLGVEAGSVSPFGLINDTGNEVQVVLEKSLQKEKRINFHPNINSVTLGIDYNDFEKFLDWCENNKRYVDFG